MKDTYGTIYPDYLVRFIGDYFSMTVLVEGVDFPNDEYNEDIVIDLASNGVKDCYGWDVRSASTIDIEVEKT